MAVDLALLECGEGSVVRLYEWDPPGLTIGYFQDPPSTCPPGAVVVRRPTGGGAILHRDELTFSLVGPASDPFFAEGTRATYEATNQVLAAALARRGVEARTRGPGRRVRGAEEAFLCFERTNPFDLVQGEKKIAGAAQRRTRERCLVHGSIPGRMDLRADLVLALQELTSRPVVASELSPRELSAARRMSTDGCLVRIT